MRLNTHFQLDNSLQCQQLSDMPMQTVANALKSPRNCRCSKSRRLYLDATVVCFTVLRPTVWTFGTDSHDHGQLPCSPQAQQWSCLGDITLVAAYQGLASWECAVAGPETKCMWLAVAQHQIALRNMWQAVGLHQEICWHRKVPTGPTW